MERIPINLGYISADEIVAATAERLDIDCEQVRQWVQRHPGVLQRMADGSLNDDEANPVLDAALESVIDQLSDTLSLELEAS